MDGRRRPVHPAELTAWPVVRSSSCTTTASRDRTSTCDWRRAACCGRGRCRGGCPRRRVENRLAIAVPDHDLDHVDYTDETKFIADTGWWEEESRDDRRIVFILHGRESARRYALIRTGDDWLLHLTKDQPAGGA